jgi:ribosomal protein S18 acetylase RimI-like enzyme
LASPDDAPAICEVFLRARAEMTYLPRLHTDEETHSFFRDVVVRTAEIWVADDGGRVVGFVAVAPAFVDHLYVSPELQNLGVGSALLERAKARRPGGLELWVFQKNEAARRFYERHGFEVVERTDGTAPGGNEEREPDVRYAWRPSPRSA